MTECSRSLNVLSAGGTERLCKVLNQVRYKPDCGVAEIVRNSEFFAAKRAFILFAYPMNMFHSVVALSALFYNFDCSPLSKSQYDVDFDTKTRIFHTSILSQAFVLSQ